MTNTTQLIEKISGYLLTLDLSWVGTAAMLYAIFCGVVFLFALGIIGYAFVRVIKAHRDFDSRSQFRGHLRRK